MKAFHGKQAIKDNLLVQLRAHYAADEIIKGVYWENGKGCAVGCTVHSANHVDYETMYGIPRVWAHLEDRIFEGLPNTLAKEWPIKFIEVIPVGADLSKIWSQFAVFLLTDPEHGVLQYAETKEQKMVIKKVADLYSENKTVSLKEWQQVRNDVYDYFRYDTLLYNGIVAATYAIHDGKEYYSDLATAAAYAAVAKAAKEKYKVAQSEKLLELLSAAK